MKQKLATTFSWIPVLPSVISWLSAHRKMLTFSFFAFAHLLGALTSVRAIMETRTSQGAVAWAISLNTFPYVAVPAYWILGRSSFVGYVQLRRSELDDIDPLARRVRNDLIEGNFLVTPEFEERSVIEKLAKLSYSRYNSAQLLVDGTATFDAIFEAVDAAADYVLVQFYIVKDDGLGNRFKDLLLKKARQGVRIYFVYDEIGSHKLPQSYISELRDGGIEMRSFNTRRGSTNRFQINFRNHRKIVITDGEAAFVGGHNVGDEYLGLDEKFGNWRDAHVKVQGPVVLAIQVAFLEDWNWAADSVPQLNWKPIRSPHENRKALCLPTGPADVLESCTLFFLHSINSAKSRIWITSPYFVPDEQMMSALTLASLRGVDVRILLPDNPDQLLVYLASFSYLPAAERAGIEIRRYSDGFLHQKVMLIDDNIATVGTANFDNRSFRLNFEITLLFDDVAFASDVEAMFEKDFEKSRLVSASELTDRSFLFRFAVECARLFDPIL